MKFSAEGLNSISPPLPARAPGTREALADAHASVMQHGRALPVWTISFNARDLPGLYAARLHLIRAGRVWASLIVATDADLATLRQALPPCLVRMPRAPDDAPTIVESWL